MHSKAEIPEKERPTYTDMKKLYAHHDEKHGFPGMLGSIDCIGWPWENCPVAYRAQFCRGDHGPDPFILLEVIASNDLWIWHAFFGVYGMNNDMNVLRQSPLFNDLKSGKAPDVPFVANNVLYKRGYYLTDEIYPQWSIPPVLAGSWERVPNLTILITPDKLITGSVLANSFNDVGMLGAWALVKDLHTTGVDVDGQNFMLSCGSTGGGGGVGADTLLSGSGGFSCSIADVRLLYAVVREWVGMVGCLALTRHREVTAGTRRPTKRWGPWSLEWAFCMVVG
ncbi:ALP1-like protein [Tanacetum coccineum]